MAKVCRIVSMLNLVGAALSALTHDVIWIGNFLAAVGCWYLAKLVEEQEKKNG